MKLTSRQKKIIDILVNEEDYIVVKELAEILDVSERTVHYDLKRIEESNTTRDFLIIKKPGLGIKGQWKSTPKKDRFSINTENQELLNLVFKRLVVCGETVSINSLSEDYYISPTSINAVIKEISNFLSVQNSEVSLIQNHLGTRVEGDEEKVRNVIVNFNDYLIRSYGGVKTVDQSLTILSTVYDETVITLVKDVLNFLEERKIRFIAPYYEYNVLNILLVIAQRLLLGFTTEMFNSNLIGKDVYGINNYLIAKDITNLLEKNIGVDISESEILRLSIHLEGNRIQFNQDILELDSQIESLTDHLIDKMSKAVNEDLTSDEILKTHLNYHLYYMIFRLNQGVFIKNPILHEIVQDFRLTYDLVWLMTSFIEEATDLEITEDELGFITLHFQSALDRKKKSNMIYLITDKSAVSMDFTINRIRRVLSPLDIIKNVEVDEIEDVDDNKIDLIVSTIPLKSGQVPTVFVSPLVSENDLKLVKHKYSTLTEEFNRNDNSLSDYIEEHFVYSHQNFDNKVDVMDFMINRLVEKDKVSKDFIHSVVSRENKGGTDISNGFAIPHGSYDDVNETTISILINEDKINWGNESINVVILYAISKDDLAESKTIIKDILQIVKKYNANEFVNSSKEEIMKIFKGEKYDI